MNGRFERLGDDTCDHAVGNDGGVDQADPHALRREDFGK